MIDIQIVPEEFQYDVQSMVQAFYMGHPFKINSQVQDYYRILKVVYEENRINIILSDNEKKLFEEHYEIDCSGIVNHCDLSKTHRTELKNVLKKLLYSVMSKDTGKEKLDKLILDSVQHIYEDMILQADDFSIVLNPVE